MAKLTIITLLLFTFALSVAFSKPENENQISVSAEPDPDSTNPTLSGSDEVTVPVNFVNFHPINRHFPRRPLTINGLQISFGNDMIISGEEIKPRGTDRSSDDVVVADIPEIKILVGVFPSEEDDSSKKVTVKLVKHKEEDEKVNYKGMFRRKIRKFLNHLI